MKAKSYNLHIISSRKKWGIYTRSGHRSLKNFKYRDLAFLYATMLFEFNTKIIVHNSDGSVDFIYNKFYIR
jgi:hypothetical protein